MFSFNVFFVKYGKVPEPLPSLPVALIASNAESEVHHTCLLCVGAASTLDRL